MARGTDRSGFDVPTRVRLLEADIDVVESQLDRHIKGSNERLDQLVAETREQTDALRGSISQNARVGVGILASLTVGSIILLVQMFVK